MREIQLIEGIAALSICESLLLALNDQKIMTEAQILGVLEDAAAAHENAIKDASAPETHQQIFELINKIIAGGNSVRHR
ncbi:hypothetical protein [uncultured Cohaesibacter sp.]|uniref:Uncharacterized protein n=2 Tax=Cohaesibacter marisflavi TaxID=655353 RepID=A0A1I5MM94_9HYPH|nr:hypothetical protein [uncultured Cohaesibacter sp.]SFP10417.1 hypothetical protein SAMN04488056_12217 [Cohaesibacter marisflavi]